MIQLEYFNGKDWVPAAKCLFCNEQIAWASLGGDDRNYRTIQAESGEVLTDKSKQVITYSREDIANVIFNNVDPYPHKVLARYGLEGDGDELCKRMAEMANMLTQLLQERDEAYERAAKVVDTACSYEGLHPYCKTFGENVLKEIRSLKND